MTSLLEEVRRRRTFAIISHPDAGKTTLTEKLLLFSGAIQIAGSVKARKASRHATSDWMEIEKQRGISVASSVMQMLYREHVINLLDTPSRNITGYLSGLSSPSVILNKATLRCSPTSNSAGQTKLPTFSTQSKSKPLGSNRCCSRRNPPATMAASR